MIYAVTYEPGQGARNDLTFPKMEKLTTMEFAALGYRGLRSINTVLAHRRNWLTASGWRLAAMIHAVTYEPGSGGDHKSDQNAKLRFDLLTPQQFAALGYRGLRTQDTVRAHRRNWQTAIDAGYAVHVEPGSGGDRKSDQKRKVV